ncbi:metallophosphoesterase [Proteinivorax tanatarense]|uniref:Metallophosphoesterase n=1 Tax=Proteinivorax tanatarense TaxID=1260629 RepID=A0AAU7VHE2_9FIRM
MALIFSISDIHGYSQPLEEALTLVDLESDSQNKLILCGDYIDYGPDSCKVLYKIKSLVESYPDQVIVLMGNHEYRFLEFLNAGGHNLWSVEWLSTDMNFTTINSFISESTKEKIFGISKDKGYHDYLLDISKIIKKDVLTNHAGLIKWIKGMLLYYETPKAIYVHAGIDEEAEEYWKHGTPDEYFLSKYPATFGKFHKDIIAGHIGTSSLAKGKKFHDIYWDGDNHFFIDGEVNRSGCIPVLKYNTTTSRYSSFKKKRDGQGSYFFQEYVIK